MPSQAEIEEYQQDLDALYALALAEVAVLVMAEDEDQTSLVDAIPTVLERFMVSATTLAMDWYRGLARQPPRPPDPNPGAPASIMGPTDRISLLDAADFEPRPAELPPREQLESTVWWAISAPAMPDPADPKSLGPEDMSDDQRVAEIRRLRGTPEPPPDDDEPADDAADEEDVPSAQVVPAQESVRARVIPAEATEQQARVISRMAGATQRYVTNAARDTVTSNAAREGVRWVRHAQPDACAFCRLLATRGPATGSPGYLTKESAQVVVGRRGAARGNRDIGELYHDDCGCEPVPVRAGDSYDPPEYVSGWVDQYYAASDEVGYDLNKILAHMRAAEKAQGGSTH